LFDFLADIHDVHLRRYPLLHDQGWRIDIPALDKALTTRTRAILLVSPNNPTGSYVQHDEQDQLVRLAAERGLALIGDEVFADYQWEAQGGNSARFATITDCLAFSLNGLSKIVALPQMKLAWMVVSGPAEARREALRRLEIIADTYLSVGTPVQLAAREFLQHQERVQSAIQGRIQSNLTFLDGALRESAVSRLRAEGGWYAVLRAPATRKDMAWALELLDRGVYVHPGEFFDFSEGSHLVVSLICEQANFHHGVEQILKTIR
jgi:aspartate/methionine/tyrosine aminotransferase